MSNISNIYSKIGAYEATYNQKANESGEAGNTKVKDKASSTQKSGKSKFSGNVIGDPKLSDEASKYYEELKKKYGNMEFILVSKDQMSNAKANAASYARADKTVVLIDEEKIERMATDSAFREKYEGILENAANSFSQFAESIKASGANVKGFGIQVNDDGTSSFFAVLEKSSKAQRERIAENKAKKAAERKAAAKKEAKEKNEEKVKESRAEKIKNRKDENNEDNVVVSADSIEELIQKISDQVQVFRSDEVMTESEMALGGKIDFKA